MPCLSPCFPLMEKVKLWENVSEAPVYPSLKGRHRTATERASLPSMVVDLGPAVETESSKYLGLTRYYKLLISLSVLFGSRSYVCIICMLAFVWQSQLTCNCMGVVIVVFSGLVLCRQRVYKMIGRCSKSPVSQSWPLVIVIANEGLRYMLISICVH